MNNDTDASANQPAAQVKNKAPAAVQITAEQLLHEAQERNLEHSKLLRSQQSGAHGTRTLTESDIRDSEELQDLRFRKRRFFESLVKTNIDNFSAWIRYASFEESQAQFDRARSVFERALSIDYRQVNVWMRYAEMEMKNKMVNHARNVWDRACVLLPRVDLFWYKYAYMEEMLGNFDRTREIFDRWLSFKPPQSAYHQYIQFEKRRLRSLKKRARHGSGDGDDDDDAIIIDKIRKIFMNLLQAYPMSSEDWLKWARFEEESALNFDNCRAVYQTGIDTIGELSKSSSGDNAHQNQTKNFANFQYLIVGFAKFEIRRNQLERARAIYKFALAKFGTPNEHDFDVSNQDSSATKRLIYNQYVQFEKQYGSRDEMEHVLIDKRRAEYEKKLASDDGNAVFDYDIWFDYVNMEQSNCQQILEASSSSTMNLLSDDDDDDDLRSGNSNARCSSALLTSAVQSCRSVFQRAISHKPLVNEKRYWRRYIYLWIKYAIFEELVARDFEKAKSVYMSCVNECIPHKSFTFAKIWIMYAKFEIRHGELQRARKLLGKALGICPKPKLYRWYIELEMELREFDRCRKLYQQFLKFNPHNSYAWIKYASFEQQLGDEQRARAIYELAIGKSSANLNMDMPELVWKSFIEFEIGENEPENVRSLYRRLLSRTNHPKVWNSFARFEFDHAKTESSLVEQVQDNAPSASGNNSGNTKLNVLFNGYLQSRGIYKEGYEILKKNRLQQERKMLLELWIEFESDSERRQLVSSAQSQSTPTGDKLDDILDELKAKLPQKVKKRRRLHPDDPEDLSMEEYFDYVFPEDEQEERKKKGSVGLSKLLAKAKQWKKENASAKDTID